MQIVHWKNWFFKLINLSNLTILDYFNNDWIEHYENDSNDILTDWFIKFKLNKMMIMILLLLLLNLFNWLVKQFD